LDSTVRMSSGAPGSLSAALVAAIRAARRLERERDSVEIVVVSPFAAGEVDAATSSVRSVWTGPVRRVRVVTVPASAAVTAVPELRGDANDGVVAAVTLNGAVVGGERVRVVRDSLSSSDSAAARAGRTVVLWPRSGGAQWASRPRADTAMAVTVADLGLGQPNATVVAMFRRAWNSPEGRVVARWADGEPAATEATLGSGCIRSVAVEVPSAGDLALTPSFRRFARRMTEPCGLSAVVALSDSVLDRAMPPTVSPAQSASVVPATSEAGRSRFTAWLLGLALAAAIAEQYVRRRGDRASA
jgi:hypothetical protein